MKRPTFLNKRFILATAAIFLLKYYIVAQTPLPDTPTPSSSYHHEGEKLKAQVNFDKLRKGVASALHLSQEENDLFFIFLDEKIQNDDIEFFQKVSSGEITEATLSQYIEARKQSYIAEYPQFLKVKSKLAQELASSKNKALAANGPCSNIGFENGTTSGWITARAKACTYPTPCNENTTGTPRIVVTNSTMKDPFIPSLSTVNPQGGNNSVRLEDFLNGGNASVMRQTFQVSATNNVFTYRYAVVLEDPQDDHTDAQRPYFRVRMYDQNNQEIRCATYTAIAKPPLASFSYSKVPNPNPGMNGSGQFLELYYRDWTTVAIPLIPYIGQNVTIEFMVSDCSLGGHLGYAYVDAECSAIPPIPTQTICQNQILTITAAPGFEKYNWSGPGIVGPDNTQSIKVNKAGKYSITYTPKADIVCPATQNFDVLEHCSPPPISAALCQNNNASLSTTGVNLNNYNTQITAYHTPPGTVLSWHSAFPASNANKIATPTNVTVNNGAKFYAVIGYNVIGGDTAEIDFTVNPKPVINFPAIPDQCKDGPSFQISGVTPAGGTFSGTGVTATGTFTPSAAGTFTIKYKVVNSFGCPDSTTKPVVVRNPPTVDAGLAQTVCTNVTSINLKGTATNQTSVLWSGGNGTFSPANNLVSTYTPTAAEKTQNSITLTLTANGSSPCQPVTDNVTITFDQIPTVDAGPAQTHCASDQVFSLAGTSSNAVTGSWTGGTGTFSPSRNLSNPTYTFSAAEISSGTVTLTYTVPGANSCPSRSDNVVLSLVKSALIDAGPAQTLCVTSGTVSLKGTSSYTSSTTWSGGAGTFSAPGSLATTYTPAASEKNAGTVTLTLTGNTNAPCPSVSDNVVITFIKDPQADAGNPQTLCENTSTVNLTGNATNASTVKWSGGSGTFSIANAQTTTYTPSESEKNSGSVKLTFTAQGNAPCAPVQDDVTISFIKLPKVSAGDPQTLCSSVSSVNLTGTASNTSGINWSGGTGIFNPATSAATSYVPASSEKTAGQVILTLTAQGITPCPPASSNVLLKFDPIPQVDPGPEQTVCGNNPDVTLQGSVTNASNLIWSGGKGTYTPSVSSPSITYTPSPEEIASGAVTLTLTSIKNSTCDPASSTVKINITPPPTVEAGDPVAVCINTPTALLKGIVNGASSFTWSSSGAGFFNPDAAQLNVAYTLSSQELATGATLTLTAYAPKCLPVSDQVKVSVLPLPPVELGPDRIVCEGDKVTLTTALLPGARYQWTKAQTPLSETTNTYIYTIGAVTDTFYITVTGANGCSNDDSIKAKGIPLPRVTLAPIDFCADSDGTFEGMVLNSNDIQPYNPVYSWTFNGKGTGANTLRFTVNKGGKYSFIVAAGGCRGEAAAMATVNPLPVIDIPSDHKFCPESDKTLRLDAIPGFTYHWYPGNETTPSIMVSSGGNYSVTITDQNHCSASDNTHVREVCPPRLFVGDAFSPDRDGVNDLYNVYGAHIGKFHMLIFNRWGEIIFESFDRHKVWDGIYRSEPMPIGVYPWIITYEGDTEEYRGPYKLEGSVTLVR